MTDVSTERSGDAERLESRRRRLLRISFAIQGAGLALALVAALVGGAAARRSALSRVEDALLLRNVAAAILLIGLSLLLIALRLPQLQQVWNRRSRPAVGEGLGGAVTPSSAERGRLARRVAALGIVWLLLSGLPLPARGVVVLAASVSVPAVAAIICVHGSGQLRAFCLGCLFPLAVNLIFINVMAAVATARWGPLRFDRLLSGLGQHYAVATFFGVVAVGTGCLCVGVRALLARGDGDAAARPARCRWGRALDRPAEK